MRIGSPFDPLNAAVGAALFRDLPEHEYSTVDLHKFKQAQKTDPKIRLSDPSVSRRATRRPTLDEIEVTMFSQGWGSTALGYGGIGGSSMTSAYTIIVEFDGVHCVYFGGGRLAYRYNYVPGQDSSEGRDNFFNDMKNRNMAEVSEAASRYK